MPRISPHWFKPFAGNFALHSRTRHALFAMTCCALLALCVIFGYVTYQARQDVSQEVAVSAVSLASAVAHDVDRNFELLDVSLKAVIRGWQDPGIQALSPTLRQRMLFDRSAGANDNGVMLVLDQNGVVRASSEQLDPKPDNFGDRDYFRVHAGGSDVGLFVSRPFVSRLSGKWIVALSRRIDGPDGSFAGIALASLELAYLDKLYAGLHLGDDDTITLFRTDGTVVTRSPFVQSDINRSFRSTDGFNQIRSQRFGSIEGKSPIDGRDRLISFHRVGNLPLIQVVEISADQAFAAWWRKTFAVGCILGLLCLSSISLLLLLNAELARRTEIEAVLARLAATDGLTDIANRRHFDETLQRAWQQAARDGSRVSLLMIDADHFKMFNDTFGHLRGDDLLRIIARCIVDCVRRPGALVARYGGEEFVVLLPSVGAAGARSIAESIRTRVAALAEPNPRAPNRMVTVSIGVGSMSFEDGQPAGRLIVEADAALYEAKAHGRNCCRLAGQPPLILARAS